jgi:hypothetical protein
MKIDGLRMCSRKCRELGEGCPHHDCRLWIDYEDEYNCSLISVYENGPLTLRQVGERLGISFARVKQIEQKALIKLKHRSNYW